MPPRKKKTEDATSIRMHHHPDHQRPVIPDATVRKGDLPKGRRQAFAYNPHLDPVLRSDPTAAADLVLGIVAKVEAGTCLTEEEKRILRSVARSYQAPWLEWAGKREVEGRETFQVDDVLLHIHERISAQAIINAVKRDEEHQSDLFAKPKVERDKQVQYYRHSMGWTNRLILGDSLQVMSSLARKENLAGKVQMVYIDPPYGINYSSNWQNVTGSFVVKDLTSEMEMIKAYRDTWRLGIHSYLDYLKERLIVAHELISETGSVFVQISDDHEHRVRALLDEVFGAENFCALIPFRKKTMPLGSNGIEQMDDFILWYFKDHTKSKVNKLYHDMTGEGDWHYQFLESSSGEIVELSDDQINNHKNLPFSGNLFMLKSLQPSGEMRSGMFNFSFSGKTWTHPAKGYCTTEVGMRRLAEAGRLGIDGNRLAYKLYVKDSGASSLTAPWQDTIGPRDKKYVVQTSHEVVKRCVLLATEPGDLVIDPTCGSGTTAFVCENWGRRWVTIDSSRVATAIARQRLLTASFPVFKTRDADAFSGISIAINPARGFIYKRSARVTLGAIANNEAIDAIVAKHVPVLATLRARIEAIPGYARHIKYIDQTAIDSPVELPDNLRALVLEYQNALNAKRREIASLVERNADTFDWVDKPEVIGSAFRVSGPFTVEGVRPEELAVGEDGRVFDSTVNDDAESVVANNRAFIERMMQLMRMDGITFLGNRHVKLASLESSMIEGVHAVAAYQVADTEQAANVGVVFGPQYGPVSVVQVGDAVESAKKNGLRELVIAGFSFDSAAQQLAYDSSNESLRVNLSHIRPDVSPGMDGLLKDQRNSQLFTVFGQPEFKAKAVGAGEYQVELGGVCVYNPLTGQVESSSAQKVAAWFLDTDYDGNCFCPSQAFFPDSKAWDKIARALGSKTGDAEAFQAFAGSTSLPFKPGANRRIAVKVIDPRGNEVMGIKTIA